MKKIKVEELIKMNHIGEHTDVPINMHRMSQKIKGWFCGCGFYSPSVKEVKEHIKKMGFHT